MIANYILTFGDPADYEKLKLDQGDRPFYISEKDALLKYEDKFYGERTKHVIAVGNYLEFSLSSIVEAIMC